MKIKCWLSFWTKMIGKLTYSYLIWQVVIHYKNFHVLLNLSFIETESFIENVRVY